VPLARSGIGVPKRLPREVRAKRAELPAVSIDRYGAPLFVYFAVGENHRLIEGSRTEVPVDADPEATVAQLWELLDDADPEHSRQKRKVKAAAKG
jgi:hypothetical protein